MSHESGSVELWKNRRQRERAARRKMWAAICKWWLGILAIGIGAGIGTSVYSMWAGAPWKPTLGLALDGVLGAVMGGAMGYFGAMLVFWPRPKSLVKLALDEDEDYAPIVNPFRFAAVVGLVVATLMAVSAASQEAGGRRLFALCGAVPPLVLMVLIARRNRPPTETGR